MDEDDIDIPGARGEHGQLTPTETRPSFLEERQAAALQLIAAGAKDSEAGRAIGLSRFAVYRWKREYPEFLTQYNEVKRITLPKLIAEAERRAMNGSDRLLEMLLYSYAPDKFRRQQRVEHTGADGAPLIPPEHAADRAAALLALAASRRGEGGPADDLV